MLQHHEDKRAAQRERLLKQGRKQDRAERKTASISHAMAADYARRQALPRLENGTAGLENGDGVVNGLREWKGGTDTYREAALTRDYNMNRRANGYAARIVHHNPKSR